MTAIDALARRVSCDDERTADQRRADAAVQLALNTLHGSTTGDLPREHGLRPSVQVTVALSTLLGLDDQPGELDGSGPIPASVARRIAADQTGTWRRLITDDRGRLLDYGRSTYRPPEDLTDHIIARDRTCRFIGCNRQAKHCDLDHQQPWEQGGETSEQNLNTLCSRHHHAKHEARWMPERTPDGSIRWTAPTCHIEEPPPTRSMARRVRLRAMRARRTDCSVRPVVAAAAGERTPVTPSLRRGRGRPGCRGRRRTRCLGAVVAQTRGQSAGDAQVAADEPAQGRVRGPSRIRLGRTDPARRAEDRGVGRDAEVGGLVRGLGAEAVAGRRDDSVLVSLVRSGSPDSASTSRLSCHAPSNRRRGSGTRRRRPRGSACGRAARAAAARPGRPGRSAAPRSAAGSRPSPDARLLLGATACPALDWVISAFGSVSRSASATAGRRARVCRAVESELGDASSDHPAGAAHRDLHPRPGVRSVTS